MEGRRPPDRRGGRLGGVGGDPPHDGPSGGLFRDGADPGLVSGPPGSDPGARAPRRRARAWAGRRRVPGSELELVGLVAGELGRQRLAVVARAARPAPRSRGGRSARSSPPSVLPFGSSSELDVVRADERVAEPVDRPDEAHHELVRRAARRARAARRPARCGPSFMTTICSATSIASSWSWVTKIVVTCTSSCRRRSQARSSLRTRASSAPNGSSSSSTLRLDRERAGQRHALALAAGELRRVAVGEAVELDELEQLVDALPRSRPSAACGSSARRRRCRARSCA